MDKRKEVDSPSSERVAMEAQVRLSCGSRLCMTMETRGDSKELGKSSGEIVRACKEVG